MRAYTVTKTVHFERGWKDHNRLRRGKPAKPPEGHVPRLSRLMALAIHYDGVLHRGDAPDMATLARYGQVTRGRMSQIMNLTLLAPDIQEDLLFLPKTIGGREPVSPKLVEPLTKMRDWDRQRDEWSRIRAERLPEPLDDEAATA